MEDVLMADRFAWRDDWSLQIETIDAEHRELVERFAEVCERFGPTAAPHKDHAPALMTDLEGLGDLAREHFRREEALMHALGYADIAEHRTEHALLLAEYADLVRRWSQDGIHALDAVMEDIIRDWILDHILGADREFATAFHRLKEQLVEVPEAFARHAGPLSAARIDL
jgi:hemerythrin-like metal-binding protein